MANETSLAESPLALHEVLESEFQELHGKLPSNYPDSPDSEVWLKAFCAAVHALKEKRAALCLSGGGSRSAIFGLGILQGIARCGLLNKFHYLSTVGGGGYIGSWLSAWIKNHPRGISGVIAELRHRPDFALGPEPRPIRQLRAYCNYQTAKTGVTSVDFWTVIAAYFRDILLNWLVLISWGAAAMMIPRLYLVAIMIGPNWSTWTPSVVRHWDIALRSLLAIAFALISIATAYTIVDVPSTGNARLPQRSFLKFYQVPMLLASLILVEWWSLFRNVHSVEAFQPGEWLLKFVVFSVASYVGGGLLVAVMILSFRPRGLLRSPLIMPISRLGITVLTAQFAGLCLWIIETLIFPVPSAKALNYICFAPALILAVLLLVNVLSTGLASWVTEDADREWWGRSAAWSLITISGWIVFNVIVLWGTHALEVAPGTGFSVTVKELNENPVVKTVLAAFGGVTSIVTALLALRTKLTKRFGAGVHWSLLIAATAFFILLAIIVSWVVLLFGAQPQVQRSIRAFFGEKHYIGQQFGPFFLAAAMLIFGMVMGFFINTNKFSLHAIYRNRLIRAYLAASRSERRPHLFTGFDPSDNFSLSDVSPDKPLHVINAALDLVTGTQLAWQTRRAVSFTMSRLHCGSFQLGYRPSSGYGGRVSLGTAMAISGAAANPNMGFHPSPVVRALMTLFNGSLGCWLGNPGVAGARTWRRAGPGYFVGSLFAELTGNMTDRYEYVKLFDGGHFENLGLYEMVLRRCHYVIVIDASEDSQIGTGEKSKFAFADLGEAVRKIRVDLGIPIDFGPKEIYPREAVVDTSKVPGRNCAVGRVHYSAVDGDAAPDGVIIYIKAVVYGDEPPDVYEYSTMNSAFPYESPSQFFSESQFESYRMLGAYTMGKLCADRRGDFRDFSDFRVFIRHILEHHLEMKKANWPKWLDSLLQEAA